MTHDRGGRSFADPDTEFELVRSGVPLDVDGHKLGAPTGLVVCGECHRAAMDVSMIRHAQDCDQRDVR